MSGPKVVLWRPMYDPRGAEMLAQAGADVQIVDSDSVEEVKAAVTDARALWIRYPLPVTAEILDAAPDLVTVSTSGFGYDKIDVPAATERGILVINNQGFGRIPVAEHTVMLLLAIVKQLLWCDRTARDGSAWERRSGLEIFELEGKTVGLIGLGWVGSEVARKLHHGFGCRVLGYDPFVDARIPALAGVERHGNLMVMLPECFTLCVCPELTPSARKMVNAEVFAALPRGAFVVNTARGGTMDYDALAEALDSGHIAAAAIDVFDPEPLPDGHPLLRSDKVLMTPHTGGLTVETSRRVSQNAIRQMMMVLKGDLPPFALNPEVWETPQSRRPRPNVKAQ